MLRARIKPVILSLLAGAVLFASAGRLNWWPAWILLGIYLIFVVIGFIVLPTELVHLRSQYHPSSMKWDVALAPALVFISHPITFVVAGLDAGRFRWSPPLPAVVQVLAWTVLVLGYAFAIWAMTANRFFANFVRIQDERGHHPVVTGPYAYVRHPAYAGGIVAILALPFVLGSLWAVIPAFIGSCLLVLRTAWEDKTLRQELAGYSDYATRVRWRLVPGVW